MKKVIAVVTTLFFLMVPTFLLAEGLESGRPTGQDSSVKAEKMDKKASKTKKKAKKSTKKSKHAKKKGKKTATQNEPMKNMDSTPAR
jgi:high-affinity K+ transport system ATPase subunit B